MTVEAIMEMAWTMGRGFDTEQNRPTKLQIPLVRKEREASRRGRNP